MSFQPLEEVNFQSGTGTLHERAVSSAILATRRLLMSLPFGASNGVCSARWRGRGCGALSDADSAAARGATA